MAPTATDRETGALVIEDGAPISFEQAIRRLEKVVASLEGGDLGLEASIAAYEDGLRLARSCIQRLDEAELRVEQLSDLASAVPASESQFADDDAT